MVVSLISGLAGLAAEGAAVALVARRRERLADLAGKIRADGGTALVVDTDITKQDRAIAPWREWCPSSGA